MVAEGGVEAYRPGFPEVSGVFECSISALDDLVNGRVTTVAAVGIVADAEGTAFENVTTELSIEQFIPAARSYHQALMRLLDGITDPLSAHDVDAGQVELSDGSLWEVL
jgi:hypothetical protein